MFFILLSGFLVSFFNLGFSALIEVETQDSSISIDSSPSLFEERLPAEIIVKISNFFLPENPQDWESLRKVNKNITSILLVERARTFNFPNITCISPFQKEVQLLLAKFLKTEEYKKRRNLPIFQEECQKLLIPLQKIMINSSLTLLETPSSFENLYLLVNSGEYRKITDSLSLVLIKFREEQKGLSPEEIEKNECLKNIWEYFSPMCQKEENQRKGLILNKKCCIIL